MSCIPETALSYDDITLVTGSEPGKVDSRDDISTVVNLCGRRFRAPIVPANMRDVITIDAAYALSLFDYFYIMHRFNSVPTTETNVQQDITFRFTKQANEARFKTISISTGVNEDTLIVLEEIKKHGFAVDFITIDIAHGHCLKMKERIQYIRRNFPNTIIIAGNVMTYAGYYDLANWGADVVKVGIGQGCFTADTRVLMANGTYCNINLIKEGEFVINAEGRPVRVNKVINRGRRLVNQVKTNNWHSNFKVTPDHNYWIGDLSTTSIVNNCIQTGIAKQLDKLSKTVPRQSKYKWLEIQKCKPEQHFLLFPKKIQFQLPETFSIDLAQYLKRGDIKETKLQTSGAVFNRFIYSSYELGYLFGAFLGDGTAFLNDNGRGKIGRSSWYFNKNENEIANKVCSVIQKIFGQTIQPTTHKNMLVIHWYNKIVTHLLAEFGKRKNKQLPQKYYCLSPEYNRGLLDGLIDSDGCIGDKTAFFNTSIKLHELVFFCCSVLGINRSSYPVITPPSKLVRSNSEGAITNLLKSNRFTQNYSYSNILSYGKILIEEEVWDIEVDCPTHSFVANNSIVHNSICTTRLETGFGMPMFSCVRDIIETDKSYCVPSGFTRKRNTPIIADGGVNYNGDVAKALVAGATMVMVGRLFAECTDSGASQHRRIDKSTMEYHGSTSIDVKHIPKYVEGKSIRLQTNHMEMHKKIGQMCESLRSSISYTNAGTTLEAFRDVKWRRVNG